MKTRTLTVTALLFSMLATSPVADAQEPVLSKAEQAVFDEAVKAAQKEQWELCRTRAAGVWSSVKRPSIAGLLGSCEAELGRSRDAAEHLDFYLQHDNGTTPAQTAAVKKRFELVRPKVMLVEAAAEPAADVRVNGTIAGSTPLRVWLDPGNYSIEISKPGFMAKTESVAASAGGSQKLDVKLKPVQSAGVGGGDAGAGGAGGDAGAGGGTRTGGGAVTDDDRPIWPTAVLASVSAAGFGIGIAGFVVAAQKRSDAEDLVPAGPESSCGTDGRLCSDVDDALGEANGFQAMGIVGVSVGAAALVGTLVYALLPAEKKNDAVIVRPAFGSTNGLVLEGSF